MRLSYAVSTQQLSKLKAYIEYFLALCTLFISEGFGQTSLFLDIAVKSIKLIVSLNTL